MAESTSQLTDKILLRRIARQDQDALLALYEIYGTLVFSLAYRIVGTSPVAEEVTQDVFVKVWRRPQNWRPALGQFRSWLLTITHNAAIDRLRSEQRHPMSHPAPLEITANGKVHPSIADDPLWYDGQILQELLGQLPVEQQELIELSYFRGMTHSQISQVLTLPLGTVKSRLRLGLDKLRTLWKIHHAEERKPSIPAAAPVSEEEAAQIAEAESLIPAYAIGATDPEEEKLVEDRCPVCTNATADLADFEAMAHSLLYSSPTHQLPPKLKENLLEAIRKEKDPLPRYPSNRLVHRIRTLLGSAHEKVSE